MFGFTKNCTSARCEGGVSKFSSTFLPLPTSLLFRGVEWTAGLLAIACTWNNHATVVDGLTFVTLVIKRTTWVFAFHIQASMMMMLRIILTLPLDFVILVLVLLTWWWFRRLTRLVFNIRWI